MNKKLKLTALVLGTCITAMAGMALAGCGKDPAPTPPPAAKKITDGIFDGSIETNPGYIRFHEKDEVVEGKSIFYCLFGSENAGTQGAGFYTVEEKAYDYSGTWETKADYLLDKDLPEDQHTHTISGTAKYTVTLTSFTGETYSTFGYEDGKLYNFDAGKAAPAASQYSHYIFNQKDDNGKDEFPVTLYSFVNTEDESRTFVISHNGSYSDDVSASYTVNGTWKSAGNTYTLTPDDPEDKGGTFVPNAENTAGTLTVDGKEYSLGQEGSSVKPGVVTAIVEDLEDTGATAQFGGYMYKFTLNDDLTWAIKVGGQAAVSGTWTFANYALTLTYDGGSVSTNPGELQTKGLVIRITLPVGEGTGECVYTIGADKVGAIMEAVSKAVPTVTAIVEDLEDTGATAQFGGYMYKFTLNDDLTWAIKVGGQAAVSGTWTFANYALTLTYDGGSVSTNPGELQTKGLVIRITLPVGEGTGECVYTIGADKVGAIMDAVAAN